MADKYAMGSDLDKVLPGSEQKFKHRPCATLEPLFSGEKSGFKRFGGDKLDNLSRTGAGLLLRKI